MAIKRWLPKPMGYQMTIRLIRQVFEQIGLQNVKVDDLTFNTCRRFLPTLGNVLGLTRHEAQAVGNWVEDPCRDQAKSSGSSVLPMSVHYSGQRAVASGLVKAKLLRNFVRLIQPVEQARKILEGEPGFVHEEALSWEVLAKLHFDDQGKHQHAEIPLADALKEKDRHSKRDKKGKKDKKDKKGKKDKKREQSQEVGQRRKRTRIDHRPSHLDRRA